MKQFQTFLCYFHYELWFIKYFDKISIAHKNKTKTRREGRIYNGTDFSKILSVQHSDSAVFLLIFFSILHSLFSKNSNLFHEISFIV